MGSGPGRHSKVAHFQNPSPMSGSAPTPTPARVLARTTARVSVGRGPPTTLLK